MKAAADALIVCARYLQLSASEGRPLTALEMLRSSLACEAAAETLQTVAAISGAIVTV